ncbi:MAG: hypothetical protein ACLRZ6_09515 [Lachnospiraceae bacterium]
MGKGVGIAGDLLDKKVSFHPVLPAMLLGSLLRKLSEQLCYCGD